MGFGIKKIIQNIAIFLLILVSIFSMISSLPQRFEAVSRINDYYHRHIDTNTMAMHSTLSFVLGAIGVFLAIRLYKRVRLAWIIEMMVITGQIILQILRTQHFLMPITVIEFIILIVLGVTYKDFSRQSDRITVKWALILVLISFSLVVLNAAIGLLIMKNQYHGIKDFGDALWRSLNFLILMDLPSSGFKSNTGMVYANSLLTLNWICICASVLLILKPLIYNTISHNVDLEKVHKLVKNYGQNPLSYLALENDKKYFFGTNVHGVAAYTMAGNVLVCCGDLICDKRDALIFISELMQFCNQNGWSILLLNVTKHLLPLYRISGFGTVKYGEDACFKLEEYTLKGNKVMKVRAAINHANKAGITVHEYRPIEFKNSEIEAEINDISKQWMEGKGEELSFMLGSINLHDPLERRYFYARDNEGKMLGFVVFLPYDNGKGYLADVTRRLPDAPQGVLEKIIYDAFMTFRDEGAVWGNLGLSPLANVREGDKKKITTTLFEFVYENLNNFYGFKALHHAKQKYNPTCWEPRYVAFYSKPFSPQFAYAIVKSQHPKGVINMIRK